MLIKCDIGFLRYQYKKYWLGIFYFSSCMNKTNKQEFNIYFGIILKQLVEGMSYYYGSHKQTDVHDHFRHSCWGPKPKNTIRSKSYAFVYVLCVDILINCTCLLEILGRFSNS